MYRSLCTPEARVNVPRQTDFFLRISRSCSLGVGAFTSTECVDRCFRTPHLVGSAASILNLEQYQCDTSTKICSPSRASEETPYFIRSNVFWSNSRSLALPTFSRELSIRFTKKVGSRKAKVENSFMYRRLPIRPGASFHSRQSVFAHPEFPSRRVCPRCRNQRRCLRPNVWS